MQHLETRRQYNFLYFFHSRSNQGKDIFAYGFNFRVLKFLTSLDVTYV